MFFCRTWGVCYYPQISAQDDAPHSTDTKATLLIQPNLMAAIVNATHAHFMRRWVTSDECALAHHCRDLARVGRRITPAG